MNFIKDKFYDWLESIKKNIGFFILWLVLTLIFGLIGVWLPIINDLSNEKTIEYGKIIINGSLSTYTIVILIESSITVFSNPRFLKNYYLITLITITFLIFSLNIFFYTKILDGKENGFVKWMTFILGITSTFLSIYMYKFKKIDPEEGADAAIEEDNERVLENANNDNENPVI